MLPRWHILYGAFFALLLYLMVPEIGYFSLALVFLASFLIDFDHYAASVLKSGRVLSLKKSFDYHEKIDRKSREEKKEGIRRKGDFHLFHTIEFHALIGILGIYWTPLFFVFLGMVFHSLLDVFSLMDEGYMYRREYFLSKWVRGKLRVY